MIHEIRLKLSILHVIIILKEKTNCLNRGLTRIVQIKNRKRMPINGCNTKARRGISQGLIRRKERIMEQKMTKEHNQECAETYYNRGLDHAKNGELKRAIEDYTKAIELNPNYADAYYNRGGAWLRLGEPEKAKSDLATARDMGSDAITALDKILQDHERAWKILGNV